MSDSTMMLQSKLAEAEARAEKAESALGDAEFWRDEHNKELSAVAGA